MRVPWTARRSNQSILKDISPECSLEGLTLKLKVQYFGHLMRRADSFEKTLMLGKIEGVRRRGQQMLRLLDGVTDSNNPVYETAKETLMYRTVLWTLWERERVGRFGRMTLKHVKYHVRNELPVQVRYTILDAWG